MTVDCVLKLCSGEELFASVSTIERESLVINNPMKVRKYYKETDKGVSIQLNFEPFMDYSGINMHSIKRMHIITCEPLIPHLQELYKAMLTSIAATLENQSIIPGNITLH